MDNWLLRRATATPNRTGLSDGVREWTFAELLEEACVRAAWLRGRTTNPRVGVLARTSAEAYLWVLGVLTSGKQVVLLNPRLSGVELVPQVARAEVDVIMCDEASLGLVADIGIAFFAPDASCTWEGSLPVWDHEAVATVVFTSGTTGRPKGVLGSFGNHWSSAMASAANLGHLEDAWVCAMPLCHVSGFSMLCKGLIYGSCVHVLPRFDAAAANGLLLSGRAGFMSVVPTMLADLLADLGDRRYPDTVRGLLLGGSPAPTSLFDAAERAGAPVIFSYGMTETSSQVIAHSPTRRGEGHGSSGLPLSSTRVRILAGRLQVQSPSVCVGYLGDEAAYAKAFTDDGWLNTGDLAVIDDKGFITILSRESELIITGGENVYPGEVERVIRDVAHVRDVVVIGVPHERWGHAPAAVVAGTASAAAIAAACAASLAPYKVPQQIVIVNELPRTLIGKPDLQAIKSLFDAS